MIKNYALAIRHGTGHIYQVMPRMLTLWLDHGRDTEAAKEKIKDEKDREKDKEKDKDREKAKERESEVRDLERARAKNLKVWPSICTWQ